MLVNRIIFSIITFILMIVLSIILKNTVMAGVITFIAVISIYIIVANIRVKKRMSLIDENCDPQGFIQATEKQRSITGKNPKISAYLDIDKAAGLILMGEISKAKDVLLSINKANLSVKNGTLLGYTINLMYCLYELGETSEAEKLFETQIPVLPPVNKKMTLAVELLVGERFFFLGRYEDSKDNLENILNKKVSKRERLEILYRLAQIDEINGNTASAKEKYKEVAANGNKLWVAKQAQKYLEQI